MKATSRTVPCEDGAGGGGHRQDAAEDDADARRPADGEDRAETERGEPAARRVDHPGAESVRPSPGPARPAAGWRGRRRRSRSRGSLAAPASSGRHVRSRTGMRRMPARLRPMTMRITPPIDAQRRQVVDEAAGRERRRRAEHREHGPEARGRRRSRGGRPASATVACAGRRRTRRPRRPSAGRDRPGTSGSTHGDRKLMTPASEGDEDRQVGAAGHAGTPSSCSARSRRSLARLVTVSRRPVAELDDRDRGEVRALPGVVRVDVPFLDGRDAGGRASRRSASSASTMARASSHRLARGAAVQDRGRGGERRSSRSDCRRGRGRAPEGEV